MGRRREHKLRPRIGFSLEIEDYEVLENLAFYLSMKKYGKPRAIFLSEALSYALSTTVKKQVQRIAELERKEHPAWKPPHAIPDDETLKPVETEKKEVD